MALLSKPLHANLNLLTSSRTPLLILVASLLLVRSRLLDIPESLLAKLAKAAKRIPISQEELDDALQRLFVREPDGTKTLLVPQRDREPSISRVPIRPTPSAKFSSDLRHFRPPPASFQKKPSINGEFLRQLRAILFRIAIPGWFSRETGTIILHSFFLVLRTILSVAVARLDGRIVRDLVSADGKGFLKGLGLWFLLAVPSIYTNSMIRHLQSKLSLLLRTRLTRYTHDLYLSSRPHFRYYRAAHEGGLEGIDQYLTADIESWAESLAGLYGNILKPTLDLVLFTSQLSRSLGLRGTVLLFATYYVTARILRAVTPAFGRLAVVEARLEGEYRAGVGRVGRESEEVAFYDGGARERDILTRAYMRLLKHVNSIYKIRIAYEWTEDYVIKYLWSAAGYGLIAVPLLLTRRKRDVGLQAHAKDAVARAYNNAVANRTETYISNRRLLLSLADAGGRLMYAQKDLLELSGLTTRLYTLISTLHNLPPLPPTTPSTSIELHHVDVEIPLSSAALAQGDGGPESHLTPPLVRDLSLVLREGDHLMITGSNGVGKTAVARVLAGLWAPRGPLASMARPAAERDVFIVPQRAYMVTGSLLDQIIYPQAYADFLESGNTVDDLKAILEAVFLAYLPEREGGWHTRKEWRDVLSGGEKQRMGMARVFYHKPRFAILDECTSAVSSDVEGRMYEHAKSLGITLITISLRPALAKYHAQMLTVAGDASGGWSLARMGTSADRVGIDREIVALQDKLAEVGKWEERLAELNEQLSDHDNDGDRDTAAV